MEDIHCPRCRTTKYRNPSLRLLVNVCGHSICEVCVSTLFVRESGSCPTCEQPLRRVDFRDRQFDCPTVERDVDVRKKILKIYNRKEDDFDSLREFNDYLEDVESIVFNIVNNINIDATKRRVAEYEKLNKEEIVRNKNKLSADELWIQECLESERKKRLELTGRWREEDERLMMERLMEKDNKIDRLIRGEPLNKECIKSSSSPEVDVIIENDVIQPEAYFHSVYVPESRGPAVPRFEALESAGYLSHTAQRSASDLAGGFTSAMVCLRAMSDAYNSLLFNVTY